MPARALVIRKKQPEMPRFSSGLLTVIVLVVLVLFGMKWSENVGNDTVGPALGVLFEPIPVKAEETKVIFNLPEHDQEQWKNFMEVNTFLYEPERFGHRKLGLPDAQMTENEKNWFMALLQTESIYYHFDIFDNPEAVLDQQGRPLLTSPVAKCIGIGQGCNLSVCPLEMWKELKTNIWCSARHFRLSLDKYPGDIDRVLADYKGAWLMIDMDFDGKKDTVVKDSVSGKPEIDLLLYPQIQKVRDLVTIR